MNFALFSQIKKNEFNDILLLKHKIYIIYNWAIQYYNKDVVEIY
ncbi:hypothetical protein HMPREF3215_00855 [Staphylococcus simulans]|nr:hypothetical protein HMPREF3215_00855 [Staphylococcus simulans]